MLRLDVSVVSSRDTQIFLFVAFCCNFSNMVSYKLGTHRRKVLALGIFWVTYFEKNSRSFGFSILCSGMSAANECM